MSTYICGLNSSLLEWIRSRGTDPDPEFPQKFGFSLPNLFVVLFKKTTTLNCFKKIMFFPKNLLWFLIIFFNRVICQHISSNSNVNEMNGSAILHMDV